MSIGDLVRIYGPAYDGPPRDEPPALTFQIATTARTGSTLLALDLWRSSLGAPFEYLNRPYMTDLAARLGASELPHHWRAVQRARTTARGIFGAKLFYPHFGLWGLPAEEVAQAVHPHLTVFLTRNDKIAQAVSLSRAVQTQVWAKGAQQRQAPTYDFEHIRVRLQAMRDQEAQWLAHFRRHAIPTLDISYENFVADRAGTCERIAAVLSVPRIALGHEAPPEMESQWDEFNADWNRRFRHDLDRHGDLAASRASELAD